MFQAFVVLDPKLQELIVVGLTFAVSFIILQVAAFAPWLAEYLGEYKVAIVTWLSGIVFQLLQAQLDKIPATWDEVVSLVMQLIVSVVGILLAFAAWRKFNLRGARALR